MVITDEESGNFVLSLEGTCKFATEEGMSFFTPPSIKEEHWEITTDCPMEFSERHLQDRTKKLL